MISFTSSLAHDQILFFMKLDLQNLLHSGLVSLSVDVKCFEEQSATVPEFLQERERNNCARRSSCAKSEY